MEHAHAGLLDGHEGVRWKLLRGMNVYEAFEKALEHPSVAEFIGSGTQARLRELMLESLREATAPGEDSYWIRNARARPLQQQEAQGQTFAQVQRHAERLSIEQAKVSLPDGHALVVRGLDVLLLKRTEEPEGSAASDFTP